ncbi:MAG TPA: tRNA pseudouridine(54/55) synthase Pus10 [Candidatus Methanofastidiosa archaeon]|nr:tRNA pseudouridine(54/55) synthase Pus10 [Candidatus Methanofastidiosa archaeon]
MRPILCDRCAKRLGIEDSEEGECQICQNVLDRTDLIDSISPDFEYESFNVGIVLPPSASEREAGLVRELCLSNVRSYKTEFNRELRDVLSKRLGKTVDLENPDVTFEINFAKGRVFYKIRSLTLFGRYRKLSREIPQTKWHCKSCRGRGCKRCDFTGKMYPTSVEEIIAAPLLEATRGRESRFHGAGREDIDVRMLGDGRPFVIEIINPKVRELDLAEMEALVNEDERVKVSGLENCEKSLIEHLKNGKFKKTYVAHLDKKITNNDISIIENELTTEIEQRTPIRVSHRRSDKIRKRKVYKVIGKNNKTTELEIYCDGGLYIKELISGDEGRTTPSAASLLNMELTCLKLDVMKIHYDHSR